MGLIFEWDANKARINLKKHRVSFTEARTVFNDPFLVTYPDVQYSDVEDRHLSIGYSSQRRILLVVYTEHVIGDDIIIRVISSRKAVTIERKAYENQTE